MVIQTLLRKHQIHKEAQINLIMIFSQRLSEDRIDAIINPSPKPASIQPININIDCGKKKKPTPMPSINPPPTAQILLSSFSFISIITYSLIYLLTNIENYYLIKIILFA